MPNNILAQGDGVIVSGGDRVVYINGREIPFHPKMKGNSITTIGKKVYIDGFEYQKGEWKRTLTALWHKYF